MRPKASGRRALRIDFVIDESTKIITGVPFDESGTDSAVWADVKTQDRRRSRRRARSTDARAKAMLAEARAALTGPFKAALPESLIAWQREDRAKAPEQAAGVQRAAERRGVLRGAARQSDHHDADRREIHAIGLAEVARLRAEMEAIKNEVGFKGDLPAFFAELRDNKDNPRYYYPNTDEGRQAYIADATAAIDKIKAVLPKYFGILPKADLVVRRVEPFREQPGAAQHYFPGTPDGSRPGVYYAHLSGHEGDAEARTGSDRVSRGPARPPHADRDRAGTDERADVPAPGGVHRVFRRLGAVLRVAGARDARHLPGSVLALRPARLGNLAGDPSRRRHRHARQGMVRGAGGAVLPRQLRDHGSAGALGDPPLHGAARPGDQLQDRHAEDPGAAAQGGNRARARASTSARSTTPCSAAARCR